MSDIHAGPDTHHPGDGLCTWVHEFGGERLRCDETSFPGVDLCELHLRQKYRMHRDACQYGHRLSPDNAVAHIGAAGRVRRMCLTCKEERASVQRNVRDLTSRAKYDLTERQKGYFWSHVDTSGECWLWTASRNHHRGGYGSCRIGGHSYRAHVLAFRLSGGRIPHGRVLDHLCRNPACVRPEHLEPVTSRENTMRGIGPELTRSRHSLQTHCRNGHPLEGANLVILNRGTPKEQRSCRTCKNASAARSRERQREAKRVEHYLIRCAPRRFPSRTVHIEPTP